MNLWAQSPPWCSHFVLVSALISPNIFYCERYGCNNMPYSAQMCPRVVGHVKAAFSVAANVRAPRRGRLRQDSRTVLLGFFVAESAMSYKGRLGIRACQRDLVECPQTQNGTGKQRDYGCVSAEPPAGDVEGPPERDCARTAGLECATAATALPVELSNAVGQACVREHSPVDHPPARLRGPHVLRSRPCAMWAPCVQR